MKRQRSDSLPDLNKKTPKLVKLEMKRESEQQIPMKLRKS